MLARGPGKGKDIRIDRIRQDALNAGMAAEKNHVKAAGFPPISAPDATVLILGSMPGLASLRAQQYYAHPRNAFWSLIGSLLGMAPDLPYAERTARLIRARIALWDVLQSCHRAGSLDADIAADTATPNDFARFFRTHRHITHIFFNGATAERYFIRRIPTTLYEQRTLVRLPSTSPAHASRTLTEKRAAWRAILAATDNG